MLQTYRYFCISKCISKWMSCRLMTLWNKNMTSSLSNITGSGRMIYPFSTDHQARCSSRKRSNHASLSSISFDISVVSMAWGTGHRAFVVETYLKCGDSVIAAQRQFRTHFGVGRHGRVPNRKPYSCGQWRMQGKDKGDISPRNFVKSN